MHLHSVMLSWPTCISWRTFWSWYGLFNNLGCIEYPLDPTQVFSIKTSFLLAGCSACLPSVVWKATSFSIYWFWLSSFIWWCVALVFQKMNSQFLPALSMPPWKWDEFVFSKLSFVQINESYFTHLLIMWKVSLPYFGMV